MQFIGLHPELATAKVAGNNVGYLAMNCMHAPFDDLRVRRAVALGIHRDPIVKLVYQGLAVPATGPLAPSMWGHVELAPREPDPARARALLEEAGWPARAARKGAKRPTLYVSSTPRPYLPAPETVARMIAEDLREIGMDVDIRVNPIDVHLEKVQAGEHDLCLFGWSGDNGDPDNFLYLLFHSDNAVPGVANNVSFFKDARLDGILRWAQESTDRAQRERYYGQAQRILDEELPWVPLAHSEIVVARRRTVHGLALLPSSVAYFADVTVDGEP
jgi:peptide/nickel transport system substrate-binding protein